MQEVKVYISISGDYCAFHEMTIKVEYDITNNIQLAYMTLEELENSSYNGYSDYQIYDAIKIGKEYFVKL